MPYRKPQPRRQYQGLRRPLEAVKTRKWGEVKYPRGTHPLVVEVKVGDAEAVMKEGLGYRKDQELALVKKALEAAQIPVARAELAKRPQNYISLGESDARKVLSLMEAIEDHDDVQKVHSNFDVPIEILEKLQAE